MIDFNSSYLPNFKTTDSLNHFSDKKIKVKYIDIDGLKNRTVSIGREPKPGVMDGVGRPFLVPIYGKRKRGSLPECIKKVDSETKRFDRSVARDILSEINFPFAEDDDEEVVYCKNWLKENSEKSLPVILVMAQDESEDFHRIYAAKALCSIYGDTANGLVVLRSIAQHQDLDIGERFMAIDALADIYEQETVVAESLSFIIDDEGEYFAYRLNALMKLLNVAGYKDAVVSKLLGFLNNPKMALWCRIDAGKTLAKISGQELVAGQYLLDFSRTETEFPNLRMLAAEYLSKIKGQEDKAAHAILDYIHDVSLDTSTRIDAVGSLYEIHGYESVAAYLLVMFVQDKTLNIFYHVKALGVLAKIPKQEDVFLSALINYSEIDKLSDVNKDRISQMTKKKFKLTFKQINFYNRPNKSVFELRIKELYDRSLPCMLGAILSDNPGRLTFVTKLFENNGRVHREDVACVKTLFLVRYFINKAILAVSESQSMGQNPFGVDKYNQHCLNELCHLGMETKGMPDESQKKENIYLTLKRLVDGISLSALTAYFEENGYKELYERSSRDNEAKIWCDQQYANRVVLLDSEHVEYRIKCLQLKIAITKESEKWFGKDGLTLDLLVKANVLTQEDKALIMG